MFIIESIGKSAETIGLPIYIVILPFTVFLSNILPEVYGYRSAKNVLLTVMKWIIYIEFFVFFLHIATYDNDNFHGFISSALRFIIGSLVAVYVSEICKYYIMGSIEGPRKRKLLWLRSIGSTFTGRLIYCNILYLIAIVGNGDNADPYLLFLVFLLKVCAEVFLLPFTYLIVNSMKRKVILDIDDSEEEMPVLAQE
jgi:uncharacterized integral membrane protein (TIGR00697 family)